MGLFDIVKDKAAELFSGASEKVSELTGAELPGADDLAESADTVTGTATGAAQEVTEAADNAVGDLTDPHRGE